MRMLASTFPLLFLSLWVCADARGGDGLLSRMTAKSELQLAVDKTAHDIAAQQLQALKELQTLGHASAIEVDQATTALRTLESRLASTQKLTQRFGNISTSVRTADEKSNNFVLLTVSDFAEFPALQPLSQLKLDYSPHWQSVVLSIDDAATSTQYRSQAWAELVRRVASVDDNDQTSQSELSVLNLKRQFALAEERLAQHSFAPVRIGKAIEPFQLSEHSFTDEVQLVAYLGSTLREARHSCPQLPPQTSITTSLVTQPGTTNPQHADLPPFACVPSAEEVITAKEALRQRVEQCQQNLRSLRLELQQQAIRCQQIAELANEDRFFTGEAKHVAERLKLTQETVQATEHRLQIRRAELEFVTAIKNCVTEDNPTGITNWKTPLLRIYGLYATTSLDEARIQQAVAINETTFNSLTTLRSLGHASWKETEAAKVRLAESRAELSRTGQQGRIYRSILSGVQKALSSATENTVAIAE